ncbi:hypothetical protein CVT24_011927 [Panaeolus cyanescens]|uniref:F-box domain-containing protein n=1 Tax=Panaeolus cyanescens TaxID=181874 RepID=A0A409VXR4_9AGAR|nr:hypothetical protein CVT24_011927 [Panaeolus cyanescens]
MSNVTASFAGLTLTPAEKNVGLVSGNIIFAKTPLELIREIMEHIIAPRLPLPFTHRPLVHPAGHPRSKVLSLLKVCKTWYIAGLPLLYRDLLITRCSQLERLLVTLQKPENSNLPCWVESIEIRDVLPQEIQSEIFQDRIRQLLQICPNLTTYAYQESFRHSNILLYSPSYPSLIPPITHLHLQWVLLPSELACALRELEGTLQSLHISFAYDIKFKQWPAMDFSFPNLHTLSIPQTSTSLGICTSWHMPNLARLFLFIEGLNAAPFQARVLVSDRFDDWGWGIENVTGTTFFKKFGSTLKVLDIYRNDYTRGPGCDSAVGSRFLVHTPRLEHLILHVQRDARQEFPFNFQDFRHSNVKYVDVWAEDQISVALQETLALGCFPLPAEMEGSTRVGNHVNPSFPFPAVRGFRIFPKTLAHWNHLPVIIPPSHSPLPQIMSFAPARDIVSGIDWAVVGEHSDYKTGYDIPAFDAEGIEAIATGMMDTEEEDSDGSDRSTSVQLYYHAPDDKSDGSFEMTEEDDYSDGSVDSDIDAEILDSELQDLIVEKDSYVERLAAEISDITSLV